MFSTYSKSGGTARNPSMFWGDDTYSFYFPGGEFFTDFNYCLGGTTTMLDVGTDEMTFSLWFKWHDGHTELNNGIFGVGSLFGHNMHMGFRSSDKKLVCRLYSGMSGLQIISSIDIDDTKWHHFCFAIDRESPFMSKLYIDGISRGASTTDTTSFDVDTGILNVGSSPVYSGNDLGPAYINDIAIWDVLLTQEDVAKIYNNGKPNDLTEAQSYQSDKSSDLIVYWRMEEGTGDVVSDSSGNGYNLSRLSYSPTSDVAFSSEVPS